MKLIIIGANGGVGGHLTAQALGAGHQVTAVVRDGRRLDRSGTGLTVAEIADMTDPAAFASIMPGHDAVLSAVGPRSSKDAPVAAPVTRAILAAMQANNLARLVTISAAPAGQPADNEALLMRLLLRPIIRAVLKNVYADLESMEAELRASATLWTAMRPPQLGDGPLTGQYRHLVGGTLARGYKISRADLAHAMLASLANASTQRQIVGLAY